jgi:ligand-binding SRPBCC domain-containing protein
MPTFFKSIVVEAPVQSVFGFHEAGDSLRLLSHQPDDKLCLRRFSRQLDAEGWAIRSFILGLSFLLAEEHAALGS